MCDGLEHRAVAAAAEVLLEDQVNEANDGRTMLR